MALVVTVTLLGIAAAIGGVDAEEPPPAFLLAGTVFQALIFAATALILAGSTARPRAWHFGLRRAPFWPTVGWAALGMASFHLFQLVYVLLVKPEGTQTIVEDLGAERGTGALIAAGVLIVAVAPVAEEFFFRGFFYRALRTRLNIWIAAAVDGTLFGAIHYTGAETISILPMLAVLGFVFCLVYERTGSLFPVIGLHSLNNALGYAVEAKSAVAVSATLGAMMIAACTLVPRYLRAPPRTG